MASLQDQFLKALVERFAPQGIEAVIETLPEDLASKFRTLPEKVGKPPELFLAESKGVLSSMHPSWYEELVKGCPEELHGVIRTAILISSGRGAPKSALSLSPALTEFLINYLIGHWPERNVEGIENSTGATFPWLLTCDEETINKLAELLAVNDVVDIVRQTVDKRILQKILLPFTPLQQRFLRSCLHRPARLATLNKELTALLVEDPKRAAKTLLKRGFEEIGVALKGEPPLFVWHVLHRMDRKRADVLKKLMEREIPLTEQKGIKKRLSQAYQFLQKG